MISPNYVLIFVHSLTKVKGLG